MEIRPSVDDADLELEVAIHNQVRPYDPAAVEDRAAFKAGAEHLSLLAFEGAEAVGTALVIDESQRGSPLARAWVLPEARRRGTGSALYRAMSAWAGRRGDRTLETWIDEVQPEAFVFARNRGFVEIGREVALELDPRAADVPRLALPAGVDIVQLSERPELVRGLYEVACECYPEIPGQEDEQMQPFETWLARDLGGPADRKEGIFVALASDEVIGYAKFHLSSARPRVAHHDLTGVKRSWRRRGIAAALKAAQIGWAREHGYERLVTRNEERNEPIRRLNERFGYRRVPGRVFMRGPLTTAGA
jgi:mycothiol synthase